MTTSLYSWFINHRIETPYVIDYNQSVAILKYVINQAAFVEPPQFHEAIIEYSKRLVDCPAEF